MSDPELHKTVAEQALPAAKHLADLGGAVIAAGAIVGALPSIAAGMSIIWYGVRLHEWWAQRSKQKRGPP